MTLRDYLKVFRHYVLLIVATAVAASALTWLLTPESAGNGPAESYTAQATVTVTNRESAEGTPGVSLGRIALYMTTGSVPTRVAKKVGFTQDPAILARRITVSTDPESASLKVASSDTNPERAAQVANAFADETVAFFAEKRAETAGSSLSILQRATPIPDEGKGTLVPPGRPVRTALAAALGLLVGLGLALILNRVDSRMRGRDEIQQALGLPIIAEVPKLERSLRERAGTVVATDPLSTFADGYRAARTAISHTLGRSSANNSSVLPGGRRARRADEAPWVLVTSANAGEGKTTSVGNLAASFAESGKRVLVIDADLRSPDTHRIFDVPQSAGISDYLTDPEIGSLTSLVRPTSVPNVMIITAGTQLAHPASLASRMGIIQEETRHLADVVLVDSAPLLAASDVFDLLPLVDTIMLVARSGKITEAAAMRVSELLGRFRVPVSGVLLIGVTRTKGRGYGHGYGEEARRNSGSRGTRARTVNASPSLPPPAGPLGAAGGQESLGDSLWRDDSEELPETRTMRRAGRSSD